ncbi:unnamed protein product, partial [Iphiclides podalirius]
MSGRVGTAASDALVTTTATAATCRGFRVESGKFGLQFAILYLLTECCQSTFTLPLAFGQLLFTLPLTFSELLLVFKTSAQGEGLYGGLLSLNCGRRA